MHPTWTGLVYNGHIGLISRKTPFQKQVMSSVCKNAKAPTSESLGKGIDGRPPLGFVCFLGYPMLRSTKYRRKCTKNLRAQNWPRLVTCHTQSFLARGIFGSFSWLRNGRLFFVAFKLPFSLVYPIWARR